MEERRVRGRFRLALSEWSAIAAALYAIASSTGLLKTSWHALGAIGLAVGTLTLLALLSVSWPRRRLSRALSVVMVPSLAAGTFLLATMKDAPIAQPATVRDYDPNAPWPRFPALNALHHVPDIGDESTNFFTLMSDGSKGPFYDAMNGVLPGDRLLLRVYVNNSGEPGLNGPNFDGPTVATGTHVRVDLPRIAGTTLHPLAEAWASNARPARVADTCSVISGAGPVLLKYIPGSARLKTTYFDEPLGDDELFDSEGALVGSRRLDGIVPGGFDYELLITFRLEVVSG